MKGPLDGIRVVDLTTVVMGPSATQILGDLGADVIKVESASGDSMRNIGPMRNPGMGPLFLQANRNKRSIVLNLKESADKHTFLDLLLDADVLISNVRPQAMARLGLDYEQVASINPRIIFCAAVGYGEGGPYAGAAVYDDLMQAASGVAGMFQRIDGKPRYAPVNLCDRIVGLYAAIAVQAALIERMQSGLGQQVEVPMFETMAQFVLADHIGGEAFVPSLGETGYLRLLSRTRGPYPTADGHLSLVVYTDAHWQKFCNLIGRETLLQEDSRFQSMQSRTTNAEAVGEFLASVLPAHTTSEWLEMLHNADIPACRVNSVDDLFTDPHLAAVNFFSVQEHPTEGALRVTRSPMVFSRTPLSIRQLAPTLNAHEQEIRDQLEKPKQ